MLRWGDFAREASELAEKGRRLLYQYGPGLAFLATVDRDCGPRLHPIVVVQEREGLYTFLVPSPKRRDLERNPRYALHAFPPEQVDDEFALRGEVRRVDDPALRAVIAGTVEFDVTDDQQLYEFLIDSALLAEYERRGQWPPAYSTWKHAPHR
jgi:hypothetical protein